MTTLKGIPHPLGAGKAGALLLRSAWQSHRAWQVHGTACFGVKPMQGADCTSKRLSHTKTVKIHVSQHAQPYKERPSQPPTHPPDWPPLRIRQTQEHRPEGATEPRAAEDEASTGRPCGSEPQSHLPRWSSWRPTAPRACPDAKQWQLWQLFSGPNPAPGRPDEAVRRVEDVVDEQGPVDRPYLPASSLQIGVPAGPRRGTHPGCSTSWPSPRPAHRPRPQGVDHPHSESTPGGAPKHKPFAKPHVAEKRHRGQFAPHRRGVISP